MPAKRRSRSASAACRERSFCKVGGSSRSVGEATSSLHETRRCRRRPARRNRRSGSGACRRSCATPARGRASRTPRRRATVSITSGPDIASRPSSLITTRSQQRATMPMPPKQPLAPPISTITGMPAARTSSSARITSDTAIRPALASCRRTPPDSSQQQHRAPAARAARARSRPTSLAPCTSPTPPPMKLAFLRGDEHRRRRRACRGRRRRRRRTPRARRAARRCGLIDALASAAAISRKRAGVEQPREALARRAFGVADASRCVRARASKSPPPPGRAAG